MATINIYHVYLLRCHDDEKRFQSVGTLHMKGQFDVVHLAVVGALVTIVFSVLFNLSLFFLKGHFSSGPVLSRENAWRIFSLTVVVMLTS